MQMFRSTRSLRPRSAFAVILMGVGLLPLACDSEELEVLTPAPTSAESSNPSASVTPTGPSAACAFYPKPACTRQLGQACGNEHECCSGACVLGLLDEKSCVAVTSCRSYCESCLNGSECCSGHCEPDERGALRCVSESCLREGEICNKVDDCCADKGPVQCVEDPKGLKTKRCRLESSGAPCIASGNKCKTSEKCCNGDCVTEGEKEGICRATCYSVGQPCDGSLPCCSVDAECVGTPTPSCQTVMH